MCWISNLEYIYQKGQENMSDDDCCDDDIIGLFEDFAGGESTDEFRDDEINHYEEEDREDDNLDDGDQEDKDLDDDNIDEEVVTDKEIWGPDMSKPKVGYCRICGAEVIIDELPDSISRDAFEQFGLCLNCQWGFFMDYGGHF
jgi:hypothetical protein